MLLAQVRGALAGVVVLLPLGWATEWLAAARSLVSLEEFVAAELTAALTLVFLSPRGRAPGRRDIALAAVTACLGTVTVLRIDAFLLQLFFGGAPLVALSGALVALALAGCYRVAGLPMTLLVAGFIAFGALAPRLPPPINAPPISLSTYTIYLAFGGDALIGQALKIVSVVVVVFILFGRLFEMIGGTAFFVAIARQVSGAGPGGSVRIAVVASALFGSISGSTTANVVSSGSLSIPMMTRIGLRPHQAAAVEAVASTGGQLMPPVMGIAAFLMVEIASLPYREVIAAAALPGILFFVSVFFQVDGLAVRMRLPSERPPPPDWRALARDGLRLAIPVVMLVATLVSMPYAPGHAAGLSRTQIEQLLSSRVAMLDAGVDLFTYLGLPFGAPVAHVQAGYQELVRYLRPDRLTQLGIYDRQHEARIVFAQAVVAMTVLTDEARRAEYLASLGQPRFRP